MNQMKYTLPSPRNQDWKKDVMVGTEKINKLLENFPMDNITELNNLIYTEAILVSDKTGIPRRKPKQKYKTWMWNEARKKNKETSRTNKSSKE